MYKEDFGAFLEQLLMIYPDGIIILIVGSYNSHTAKIVTKWLADYAHLEFFYLTKSSSHLNPLESIWLRLKDNVATDRFTRFDDGIA